MAGWCCAHLLKMMNTTGTVLPTDPSLAATNGTTGSSVFPTAGNASTISPFTSDNITSTIVNVVTNFTSAVTDLVSNTTANVTEITTPTALTNTTVFGQPTLTASTIAPTVTNGTTATIAPTATNGSTASSFFTTIARELSTLSKDLSTAVSTASSSICDNLCQSIGDCQKNETSTRCDCPLDSAPDPAQCASFESCLTQSNSTLTCTSNCTRIVSGLQEFVSCECVEGETCESPVPVPAGQDNLAIILGVVFGFLALALLLALVYCFCTTKKRRATKGSYNPSAQEKKAGAQVIGITDLMPLPPMERLI
ncbi:Hypp1459 [Branchiostoma lanceolatum]|uniref:Hypp1459 protein n=1 Tax=Branchiostoma lanceolatum TaxID=7740 RepID=A0A8J9ZLG9_BRALA|nr:Hypp1459 [Branchiostoma lanceolatum]